MERKRRTSNGNLVNVGNADAKGTNVNNWNPDNANDNIGVSFSRSLPPTHPANAFDEPRAGADAPIGSPIA